MDVENFTIKKEVFMMASGRIITCMVLENCTIPMAKWHMKDNGLSTSFMEREKFTMISQQKSLVSLTTKILMTWMKNGNIMMELLCLIRRKDLESLFCLMENVMKDSLRMIKFMGVVNLQHLVVK